jgi:hypothetical protein
MLMSKAYVYTGVLLVSALLLASCAESAAAPGDQNNPGAVEITPGIETPLPSETPHRGETRSTPPLLEQVEITLPAPIIDEVPQEILEAIIADLVESSGSASSDIDVIRADAVVWNDGALGCPRPGEFYIQMMVNGYRVVLGVEGIEYDYRISDKGSFTLCEGGSVVPPGVGNDNPLVRLAKEDLAERLGIPIGEIAVVHIQEVTWRDGSLGCPQPGMFYTQALVNGTLLQLEHDGIIYQYHSGGSGAPFLCENPPKNIEDMFTPDEALPGFGDQ